MYATGWNILVAEEVPASLTVSAVPEPKRPLVRTACARAVRACRAGGGRGVETGPMRMRFLILDGSRRAYVMAMRQPIECAMRVIGVVMLVNDDVCEVVGAASDRDLGRDVGGCQAVTFQVVDVAGESGLEVSGFDDWGKVFACTAEAMDKDGCFGTVSYLLYIYLLSSYFSQAGPTSR